MHEQGIAQDIIKQAMATAKERGKDVKGITVEVGDLGHLPAEEMEQALQTMVSDWYITMKHKPATIKCGCGYTGAPNIIEKGHDHNVYRCPACEALMPEIVDGDQIVLESIDVT
ncbi:hydrogenase maturation nickel metallochaperone HypA [Candidatus Woesearchaeota archaeon]|nr:hydrogenase maturation nickel metallochaperone HypA [Candidatus Woesearchaeota archaeon]